MNALQNILSVGALALYYIALTVLALYGLHRLSLIMLWIRARRRARAGRTSLPAQRSDLPRVTVQLPIYNELYVAERLIDAACDLDYPSHLLEIQVLDDSTDETRELVAAAVSRRRALGDDIVHLHRTDRSGFKAGALAAGLTVASGELLAIFDADFVPRTDFLRNTVAHFQDETVGMVQTRWDHLNRGYSLLTRIQAILLDGHFAVEHAARADAGRFFNFNGTAGIWRKVAIEQSGGWSQDTLTEDLDLSYRAQLAGWRFRFLPEVTVPAELPVDIQGFKRQQYRWAKGSIQTARKLLGRVLTAPLPMATKLEATIHLTNNAAYLMMILLSLLVFPAMVVRHNRELHWLTWLDFTLFGAATLTVLLFYVVSQFAIRPRRPRQTVHLLSLMALGIGLSVNNCRAVLSGLTEDGGTFERTPKYSIESRGDRWTEKKYRIGRDATYIIEGLLAAYLAVGLYFSWQLGLWRSAFFIALFFMGYCYIFVLSITRQLRRAAHPRPSAPTANLSPGTLTGP